MTRAASLALLLVAAAALVASCSPQAGTGSSPRQWHVPPAAEAAVVRYAPVPPLRVTGYRTAGAYPTLSEGGRPLRRVNASLLGAVRADQTTFLRFLPTAGRPPTDLTGTYELTAPASLTVSRLVVSMLVPTTECYAGAVAECSGWLAASVRIPSGRPVTGSDLLLGGVKPARRLARMVVARLSRAACVSRALEPLGGTAGSFLATAKANWRLALGDRSLLVAFDQGTVAAPPCGPILTALPYGRVTPLLSPLARRLVASLPGMRDSGA